MRRMIGLVLALAPACEPDRDPLDQVTASQASATSGYQPPDPTDGSGTTSMFEEPDLGVITDSSAGCGSADSEGPGSCDVWAQDCSDGCKCMPYAESGAGYANALKCTPVVPNAGALGEPCTVAGHPHSGFDSCAEGFLCWNVDPETGLGTCFEQCKGSILEQSCTDANSLCFGDSSGVWYLCLPTCHPLDRPCPDGEVCTYNPLDIQYFTCADDVSGEVGQAFDVCEYANACDPGLSCVNAALAEECDQRMNGCCLPFCDVAAPDCPGVGQECLPWYEDGMALPGYEDLGVCGVPQ